MDFRANTDEFLYLLSIAIVLLVLFFWVFVRFSKAEKDRLQVAKDRDSFDSLKDGVPTPAQSVRVGRRQALHSIHERFVRMRRFVLAAIFIIGAPLMMLPFLEGTPSVTLSLFIGIATAVIGIALRPIVENAFSGLVLSMSYPARIGDTVLIDGHYGTIERIGLTQSVIKIWDWRRYVIPNSKFLQKEFINLSFIDKYEWAAVEFWVDPKSDIDLVERLAVEIMKSSKELLSGDQPAFWVMGLNKEAVQCWVCGWAETPSLAWNLKSEVRKGLMKSFQDHDILYHSIHQNVQLAMSPDQIAAMTAGGRAPVIAEPNR